VALDFERGRAGRLSLPELLSNDVVIDLSDAVVSQFHDQAGPAVRAEAGYRPRLAGFTYDSLGHAASDCSARLAWLARATDGYVAQAYDQLAAAFRRAGREDDARKVMLAKQIRRRRTLQPLGQAASYAFGAPVGYGYRTWRAVAVLAALVVSGWWIFSAAYPEHMTATRRADQLPDFHALVYAIDSVLPVVNLGQETSWAPQGVAQAWYVISVVAGWMLGLGLVAFVTARFFRE
jgi:hypothetical protein